MSQLTAKQIEHLERRMEVADDEHHEWIAVEVWMLWALLRDYKFHHRNVKSVSISFAPIVQEKGEEQHMSTKLIVGGLRATLTFADAQGNDISAADALAAGLTVAAVSSNPAFATVAPTAGGDGISSFDVLPVDPTATATGSSVVSFTATDADGTQAVATAVVANVDDVASLAVTLNPIQPPAGSSAAKAP